MYTDSSQTPENLSLSGANSTHISFTWRPVSIHCESFYYALNTSNCGLCPVTSNNSEITCSGLILDGRICHVLVQTVVCNMGGSMSRPFTLKLKGS